MSKSTEAQRRRRRARQHNLLHATLDHAIFLLCAAVICGSGALIVRLLMGDYQ
jgi:hypothetical protein